MNKKIINQYLLDHQNDRKVFEQDYFKLAICLTQLGNYAEAIDLYKDAIVRILEPNAFWSISGQPNWLVDIFVLSGKMYLFPSIMSELNLMRTSSTITRPIGSSLPAQYCYSVMELICPDSGNISEWIKTLLKWPKIKDYYAIGQCLQAIIGEDQISFNQSLFSLLKSHEGKAKQGELRCTPEGWLCLPAMTLSFLAIQKKLKIEIDNVYLCVGYLSYLGNHLET